MGAYTLWVTLALPGFLLFIGLKVLLFKKPLFLPSNYLFALAVLATSPILIHTIVLILNDSEVGGPAQEALLGIWGMWTSWHARMKGYIAIGAPEATLQEAIYFSLERNDLTFEERITEIELTAFDAKLRMIKWPWMGWMQLRLENMEPALILREIGDGINEYYRENHLPIDARFPILYCAAGALILAITGVL